MEQNAEEGTLSIMRRGNTYQVRYASNNPHGMDRQPYSCTGEEHLGAFLQQLGTESWSIHQSFVELWKGSGTVLFIVLSATQIQVFFPLPPTVTPRCLQLLNPSVQY